MLKYWTFLTVFEFCLIWKTLLFFRRLYKLLILFYINYLIVILFISHKVKGPKLSKLKFATQQSLCLYVDSSRRDTLYTIFQVQQTSVKCILIATTINKFKTVLRKQATYTFDIYLYVSWSI